MKAVGLNTVRIQIGCKSCSRDIRKGSLIVVWSIIPLANGEPFLEGAYPYLKVAVDWAQTLGLKVSISFWKQYES
jgi:glucan 1,3-beta-glucosidase